MGDSNVMTIELHIFIIISTIILAFTPLYIHYSSLEPEGRYL